MRSKVRRCHGRSLAPVALALSCGFLLGPAPGWPQMLVGATQTLEAPLPEGSAGGYFGRTAVWADADADGLDELIVSYRNPDTGGYELRLWRPSPSGLVLDDDLVVLSTSSGGPPALAACDFDLANPGEEVFVGVDDASVGYFDGTMLNFVSEAGSVAVYSWPGDGVPMLLDTLDQGDSYDEPGDPEPETGDEFGHALATGDFDGDQQCDIAIGVPGQTVGILADQGIIQVRRGPLATGTWTDEVRVSDVAADGEFPILNSGDRFGEVLAAGNLIASANLGNPDQLVVGSPFNNDQGMDAGNVRVLRWSFPLASQPFQGEVYYASDAGLAEHDLNRFGSSLAIGDVTGDGIADLAVGAPNFRVGVSETSSGTVVVFPSSGPSGLSTTDAITLAASDLGETPDSGDDFGQQVAIARVFGGLAHDLIVAAPGIDPGGVVALFRGDQGLVPWQTIEQADVPGEDAADDEFGETFAVGDLDADATMEIMVAAPREDREVVRGLGPGQDVGVVHVLRAVPRMFEAQILVTAFDSFATEELEELTHPPRHNPAGEAILVAASDTGDDVTLTTTQVVDTSPDMLPFAGLDALANVAWVDSFGGRLFVSSQGVVFEDGTVAPVGGLFDFTAADDVWLRDNQRLFFLTQTAAPLRRVLLRRDLPSTEVTLLLESGDRVGDQTVADILFVHVSPDGNHWMAEVDLGGGMGLVLDGDLIYDGTAPGSGVLTIRDFTVGNDGNSRIALLADAGGLVADTQGSVVLGSAGEVDGLPLDGMQPGNVAVSARGDVVTAWSSDGVWADLLTLLCADPAAASPRSPLLSSLLEGERGLAAGTGERILVVGDAFDLDGDGGADATLLALDWARRGAPEVAEDGTIVVRATLQEYGSEVLSSVLLRVRSPTCPLFADDFESGDTESWNSASRTTGGTPTSAE